MAALLTIEAANTDKLAMYLGECRDLGIPILAPDINKSQLAFTVEKDGVRFGLCAVKNVGEGAILSMLGVRKELGRIDSLYTLCEQVDQRLVNKRPLESLVKAGAFDSLAPAGHGAARGARGCSPPSTRRSSTAAATSAIARTATSQLFGGGDEGDAETGGRSRCPTRTPWTETQQLAFEKESLGLYMSGHPLERFTEELKTFGAQRVAELTGSLADVWVGGIVSGLRPLKTKKGDRMAVFMLDDIAGGIEVVVFPETFGKCGHLIAGRRDAARPRQAREGRRNGAHRRDRAAADLAAQGADDARGGDPPARPRRATRWRRSPSCSRATAATAACRWSWT